METLPLVTREPLQLARRTRLAILVLACLTFAVPTIYLSQAPAAQSKKEASGKSLQITLPGGAKVELVGVNDPSDKGWWTAEGTKVDPPDLQAEANVLSNRKKSPAGFCKCKQHSFAGCPSKVAQCR